MLAPTDRAPNRPSPLPLPSALQAAELGPVVMADDPCEAAFSGADPTGPRNYYRARYYDPKIGRFLSEDPIGFKAGINLYAYVGNRPTRFTDPMGLEAGPPGTGIEPIDLIRNFRDAQNAFQNEGDWTRDRERHCYLQCISFRRKVKANPVLFPLSPTMAPAAESVRLFKKFLENDIDNMMGDAAADANGIMGGYMFWKSCEEICETTWCRREKPKP